MAGPLLGLLGLAGGALGQEWYYGREEEKGRGRLRTLMGAAPDPVPDGGYGNPTPGSGLMADPSNTQRQLEFMEGLMSGMTARQRAEVRAGVEPILGRASQERVTKEGWGVQAAENQKTRDQAESHFQISNAGIGERFERSHGLLQEQFAYNQGKDGLEQAWRQYTFGIQNALAQAGEGRAQAKEAYDRVVRQLDLQDRMSGVPKVQPGYRSIMLPTGVPSDAPLPGGVMGPVRTDPGEFRQVPIMGTTDWVTGQTKVDLNAAARVDVQKYLDHVKANGFVKTGEQAGVQKNLYTRTQDAIRAIRQSGTMNVTEMPLIKEELPDPTEVLKSPNTQAFILGHLGSLQASLGDREKRLRQQYRGWNLTFPDLEAGKAKGVSAPPPGSVEIERGGYGGRGSGR